MAIPKMLNIFGIDGFPAATLEDHTFDPVYLVEFL
jgi:hypothetical protein